MKPPALPFSRFLLYARQLLSDRPEGVRRIAREYGDIVRVPVPGKPFYLLSSPGFAKRVLETNSKNYRKSFDFRIVRDFLGDGLITVHDDLWRLGRQSVKPALKKDVVDAMIDTMVETIGQKCAAWERHQSEPFFALQRMTDLTLKLLTRALFRIDLELDAAEISGAVNTALRHLDNRLAAVVDWSVFVPTPSRRRFERATRYLDGLISGWIEVRKSTALAGDDVLSTLMRAAEHLPAPLEPRRWLRDQILTLLLAGHETSAVAMSWCLYLLAQHPAIQARLATEARTVLAGRSPTRADLPRLAYHQMVVREALRLYPPVWSLGREAVADDWFGDYRIPAGSTVMVCPYVIHRHPEYWPRPDVFDPERFADEANWQKSELSWLPFSSGPRFCAGARLGMIELQLILVMIIQRFEISMGGAWRLGSDALISLRPHPDIPIRFTPREAHTAS